MATHTWHLLHFEARSDNINKIDAPDPVEMNIYQCSEERKEAWYY